jgi:hypothetical protein
LQVVKIQAALVSVNLIKSASECPIRPDQQDNAEAVHRFALLTGKHPGQPFDRRGKWLRNHRIVDDEIAPLLDEERAQRELKEFLP